MSSQCHNSTCINPSSRRWIVAFHRPFLISSTVSTPRAYLDSSAGPCAERRSAARAVRPGRGTAEGIQDSPGHPGLSVVVFERSGHVPFFEEPDAFVRALEDFLGK